MYRVYWNQAAAAYTSLYFFIFLSLKFSNIKINFQTLKFFVTLFSGAVRPRMVKLGTHVDSGQMYRVYWNQAAAAYSTLYFSFFFLSNFQRLKCFVTLFSETVRPRGLKLGTHVDNGGCIVCTGIMLLLLFVPSIFFLSNFQALKIFVGVFLKTVRPRRLKPHTNTNSG